MAIPNSRNFSSCYIELCKAQHLRPLPVICVSLPQKLDFTTDRVKMDDWGPILNSLTFDRSLKSISIRSRFQCRKPLEEVNSEDKAREVSSKAPVVLTRYLLEWLSHSVSQCVKNSMSLTVLELEGIPFPADCLAVLCVGLTNTRTLRHLSLQRCYIGDSGCELICRTIVDVHSIRSLNLSFCNLSFKCGTALAAALSKQKLLLYHDAWKESLRYRDPDLEGMPGLRRLTLNDNPHLGDAALLELIEAVRDSLWVKALDLQRCGLSNRIGNDLLELLDHNNTLVVLDVRQNANLNEEFIKEVVRRLNENNAEGKSEYRWLGMSQSDHRSASAGSRKRTDNPEANKTVIRPHSAVALYSRKSAQKIPLRRPIPMSPRPRRLKTKPPLPQFPKRETSRRRVERPEADRALPPQSKMSLHLDLQAQIQRVTRDGTNYTDQIDNTDVGTQHEYEVSLKSTHSEKVDVGIQIADNSESVDAIKFQKLMAQLADMKMEYSRLLDEAERNEAILREERGRRESTEAKLRAARETLVQMEEALKEKESEARDFLLLSQQSLSEICSSFDRLQEMLESVARNPLASRRELSEAAMISEDIKRRMSSVIRKTKSENLKRGYNLNAQNTSSPRFFDSIKKFAKSESDMRSNLPPPSKLHIERDIGDNPNVRPASPANGTFHLQDLEKVPMTPSERARAIFASIVNGGNVLDFDSQVD